MINHSIPCQENQSVEPKVRSKHENKNRIMTQIIEDISCSKTEKFNKNSEYQLVFVV